jgi:hypothetical protein
METFQNIPSSDIPGSFLRKCDLCCLFPDFCDSSTDENLRNCKTELLSDISNGLTNPFVAKILTSEHISAIFRMCSVNLFRLFPHVSLSDKPDFIFDREFCHIELIYEILLKLFSFSTVSKELVASQIHQAFINNLFSAVCSYDSREQKYVVQVLASLLRDFPCTAGALFRRICRSCIPLDDCAFRSHALPSIAALLALLAPIVVTDVTTAGRFFRDFVLPLHKCESYPLYHNTLSRLVIHVITLDRTLFEAFIRFVTKHWPVRSRPKCAMLFDEVSQVCDAFAGALDAHCASLLLRRAASFFGDPAGDVSQAALLLASSACARECPALVCAYHRAMAASAMHWIAQTRDAAAALVVRLCAVDPRLRRQLLAPDPAVSGDAERARVWMCVTGRAPEGSAPLLAPVPIPRKRVRTAR